MINDFPDENSAALLSLVFGDLQLKISYIVPVYNGQSFILRCLDSILTQRFRGVEVIFVDDGSADDSARMLREASYKHKNCRAFFQQNSGSSVARNRAIREAKGEYLAILDVDDIAIGERSQIQYEVARERKLDLVVGGSKIIDVNRNYLGTYRPPARPSKIYHDLIRRKASFHHSSCLMKTSKVVSLGGYCSRLRQAEDLDLFFRLFTTGTVAAVREVVVEHTRCENSLSNGPNLEESLFFGVFVTAFHLLRVNKIAEITKMEDDDYSKALECSRNWFADSWSIKEFRFRQEIKHSLNNGALAFLQKTSMNPRLTGLCALAQIRGDLSPSKLAAHLVESGAVADLSSE